jgi:RNase adapter protein RapZ
MTDTDKRRLIFVSGLSGAGKSVVLHTLEDLDFYCIDNFPIGLLDRLSEQINQYPKLIAIGINARSQEDRIPELAETISSFRHSNVSAELIFLEADNDVLTKRYSETRRKHPFSTSQNSLHNAIENEQGLLNPLADIADLKIDTSHTTVHDLRKIIHERVAGRKSAALSIQLISFGYKHGAPRDADFIFDVRCLPNPYWINDLRAFSGKDQPVMDYLEDQPLVQRMTEQLSTFLTEWIPRFEDENRSYLTIAIGCTGGRHRSVYIVGKLADTILATGRQVIVRHRDL